MTGRVLILGAPGAGKSTLGKALAAETGLPYHALDSIAFVDERWTSRPLLERQTMVAKLAAEPGWIAEGVHLAWTDPLLASADLIVWLDPPWWTLMWRAGARHFTRWRHVWPALPDLRALIVEGWVWVGRYYWQPFHPGMDLDVGRNLSRSATSAALEAYSRKVVRVRTSRTSSRNISGRLHYGHPAP